ncbi:hypothetical protein [Moorena bouillonii]|uniref:hypothetical protein n=1 Tax=Moorena bouillonii TaxID=207920 RepID=UPI0014188B69|nr:hypothetical protein [Moorena bouillonii]NEO45406.1 hypothetical protein [Moorena sp. SIO4A3]
MACDRKSLSCLVYNRCDRKTLSLPAPCSLLPTPYSLPTTKSHSTSIPLPT